MFDYCFKGLTPLHLCALLDDRISATVLLGEAADDRGAQQPEANSQRPTRQQLLQATCDNTATSLGEGPDVALWTDLSPLHLALLWKNLDVAEALLENSAPETVRRSYCTWHNGPEGVPTAMSPLLLAYEKGLKEIHKQMAKKLPAC